MILIIHTKFKLTISTGVLLLFLFLSTQAFVHLLWRGTRVNHISPFICWFSTFFHTSYRSPDFPVRLRHYKPALSSSYFRTIPHCSCTGIIDEASLAKRTFATQTKEIGTMMQSLLSPMILQHAKHCTVHYVNRCNQNSMPSAITTNAKRCVWSIMRLAISSHHWLKQLPKPKKNRKGLSISICMWLSWWKTFWDETSKLGLLNL